MSRSVVAREAIKHETPEPPRRGGNHLAVLYPGSYAESASSLGVHFLVSTIRATPGFSAGRILASDPRTIEEDEPLSSIPVILASVAWELQMGPLIETLRLAKIPPLAAHRDETHPVIIAGGALTHANADLLTPIADVVVRGDGEHALDRLLADLGSDTDRDGLVASLGQDAGEAPRDITRPVSSAFTCPHSALGDMHLVEVMRGCPHGCDFCVLSRRAGHSPHYFDADTILATIPDTARRVGLVGPSILDHPEIEAILSSLIERKLGAGISSARANRVDDTIASRLGALGLNTLTVALDGPSARIRRAIHKNIKVEHVVDAARTARAHSINKLKLYVMLGFADETDEDIDELIETCLELSTLTSLAVSVGPVVPKTPTPLASAPFVAKPLYSSRIKRIRKSLDRKVKLDVVGWREARDEATLASMTAATFGDLVGAQDPSKPFELRQALKKL